MIQHVLGSSVFRSNSTCSDHQSYDETHTQVTFENCLEDIIASSSSDVFTMAETTGAFFEAYRHVLEGLQDFGASPRDFPMARYLVDCNTQVTSHTAITITTTVTMRFIHPGGKFKLSFDPIH